MYKTAIASACFATVVAGLPSTSKRAASTEYTCYHGNGSEGAGWPATSSWVSFDDLWALNEPSISASCENNSWGANNSPDEMSALKSAIEQVASETNVDAGVILGVVMQESKGCVRVPTTNNGVRNPGLMQSHDGSGTCADVDPCPSSAILQMIEDGVKGTSSGPGLQQLLAGAGDSGSQAYYVALRDYNSGSDNPGDMDAGMGATGSYVCDIANTLMGWVQSAATPRGSC